MCDVAAVVAIVDDLANRREGDGSALYQRARDSGLTLAVPVPVLGKAATVYLAGAGRALLGAFLAPEVYREPGDPQRAVGARGAWLVVRRPPDSVPGYAEMLAACGNPVTAYVAAYAAETGWPVATDNPAIYAELLGRDDAVPMPPLPG